MSVLLLSVNCLPCVRILREALFVSVNQDLNWLALLPVLVSSNILQDHHSWYMSSYNILQFQMLMNVQMEVTIVISVQNARIQMAHLHALVKRDSLEMGTIAVIKSALS